MSKGVDQELLPDIAIHPGVHLADIIEERGQTQVQLASLMGRPPQLINEVIRGKKNITHETAVELETALGFPVHFWMNLQALYDATLAKLEQETRAGSPAKAAVLDAA